MEGICNYDRTSKPVLENRMEIVMDLLLTMSASLGYLTIGLVRGFSSPGVPSMQELSPHLVPDDDAVSWVRRASPVCIVVESERVKLGWPGASPPLGAFLGSLVAGPMLQYIGRKKTLMMSSPMFILGWAAIALAKSYPVLALRQDIHRLLCWHRPAFSAGLWTANVHVSECAHAEIRGILGSLPALFMAGGILVSYLLGAWLPWNLLAWASAIFPTLLFFVMIPLPESPAWLLSKDRTKDADEALKWLHHQPRSVTSTLRLEMQRPSIFTVDPEFITAESLPPSEKTPDEDSYSLKELLRRPVLVPFVLSFTLLIFQQVSGIDSIIFYTVTIFKASGSSLNEHLATIIVGLVQLLANFFSLFLIDRSGRRPLLLASGALMCLSMLAMGTHFYLQVHFRKKAPSVGVRRAHVPVNDGHGHPLLSSGPFPGDIQTARTPPYRQYDRLHDRFLCRILQHPFPVDGGTNSCQTEKLAFLRSWVIEPWHDVRCNQDLSSDRGLGRGLRSLLVVRRSLSGQLFLRPVPCAGD
uniref:Major facilitator superfamily (MFS) profile domain-containing protein n=1 Tax=Timema poppense TaxID=170557 RepID=A0A7R9DD18_TIMPO|nr:unnamed protein product [Timema poppensis]